LVAWPPAARAQQELRRVAVIMAVRETDPEGRGRLKAFLQGFQQLGWIDGHNVRIDVRWADGSVNRTREIAAEFAALAPDVIIVNGTPATVAMKRETSSIPMVFVQVNEPVAQGLIASVARPGGNITGFTSIDFSVIWKSVELLKTLAPKITRVGLMFNPEAYPYFEVYLRTFQAEGRLQVEVKRVAVRTPAEIVTAIEEIAAQPGGSLAVLPDGGFTSSNIATIRAALERHRLPYVVPFRQFVTEGALMSYGPDSNDIFRRSAEYVDRILKGAKPAELPAQAPTKFELVINLKTAKALGLAISQSLLIQADEVIE